MKKTIRKAALGVLMMMLCLWMLGGAAVLASEQDNSLTSLGIITEGVTLDQEFEPGTWECTATVPAGTTELELDPVTSNPSATVTNIEGTTLTNGEGTVLITVQAVDGSEFTYTVHVVSAAPVETEPQTEAPQTEAPTEAPEPETEDGDYVKVERASLEEAESTISSLKGDVLTYKDKLDFLMKVLYGLIGLAVVLLFIIINLLLKNRDLKGEVREYRSYGYTKGSKVKAPQREETLYDMPETDEPPVDKKAEKRAKKEAKKEARKGAKKQPVYDDELPRMNYREASVKPAADEYVEVRSVSSVAEAREAEQPAPLPKRGTPDRGKKAKDVEINMIDL